MITARGIGLSRSAATWLCLSAIIALSCPTDAQAQEGGCELECSLVLGLSSFTVATGAAVAWGRISGGVSTRSQGTAIWTVGFGATLAAAAALESPMRRRAVYASGIGAVTGALVGFAFESLVGSGEQSTKVAATLIGAAVGAIAGGVYGGISYEEEVAATGLMAAHRAPLLAVRLSF